MQRAAVSIPSNIAEGSERSGKDFRSDVLRISIGSAAELRTQAYIASKVELIDNDEMLAIVEETKQLAKMIQSLIKQARFLISS